MAKAFIAYKKNIFKIAMWSEVGDVVEDYARDIAQEAQRTVKKTKKRQYWEIDEDLEGIWDISDPRNLFRIEHNQTQSGRKRSAVIVHSPDKAGRRDGRAALNKVHKNMRTDWKQIKGGGS